MGDAKSKPTTASGSDLSSLILVAEVPMIYRGGGRFTLLRPLAVSMESLIYFGISII